MSTLIFTHPGDRYECTKKSSQIFIFHDHFLHSLLLPDPLQLRLTLPVIRMGASDASPFYAPESPVFDYASPVSYNLEMTFNFEQGTYTGRNITHLINESETTFETVDLDASSELLVITQVNDAQDNPIPFTHENDLLVIDHLLDPGEELILHVNYTGTAGRIDGPFGGMGVWMTANRAWSFSFPDGAHAWMPIIDDPAMKAPLDITLRVPSDSGFTAVANGTLIDMTDQDGFSSFHWSETHPVCSSEIGFAIGNYEVIEDQAGETPVRYYVYPQHTGAAATLFARIPEAVALYEETFGFPYPFDELKIVEVGNFNNIAGQEHQTMISLVESMFTGDLNQSEDVVVHELAHQWFADLVTPLDWDHFWLNEGFAVWSEAIWANAHDGWDGYLREIISDRAAYMSWESQGNDYALVNSDYDATMATALPYERGALTLHQLYMKYGEDAFREAVSNYLNEFAYGSVVSNNLMNAFQSVTEDESLPDWFDEWVYRGELPLVHWVAEDNQEQITLHFRQVFDQPNSPSHNLLYDHFRVTVGYDDQVSFVDWPEDSETCNLVLPPGITLDEITLFPNYEVLARTQYRDNLENWDLKVTSSIANESRFPDKVLQSLESAELTIFLRNDGLPLSDVEYTLQSLTDWWVEPVQINGTLDNIDMLQPSTPLLTTTITARTTEYPSYARFLLTLQNEQFQHEYELRVPVHRPEILLLSDGAEAAVVDTLGQILTDYGIVWSSPKTPLAELPSNMYEADAVMLEVDGRYATTIFSDQDDSLRAWFTTPGNGCISGEYIDLAYVDAHPDWNGGIAGEWFDRVTAPAFVGIPDDPVSDNRIAVPVEQQGVSTCTQCCGGPQIFLTPGQEGIGARTPETGVWSAWDSHWRNFVMMISPH